MNNLCKSFQDIAKAWKQDLICRGKSYSEQSYLCKHSAFEDLDLNQFHIRHS